MGKTRSVRILFHSTVVCALLAGLIYNIHVFLHPNWNEESSMRPFAIPVAFVRGPKDKRASAEHDRLQEVFLNRVVRSQLAKHSRLRKMCESNRTTALNTRLLVYRGSHSNFGLGDRVRGALDAFLTAGLTDRLFLVDIRHPFPVGLVWINPPGFNFTYDPAIFPFKDNFDPRAGDATKDEVHMVVGDLKQRTKARVILYSGMPAFHPDRLLQRVGRFAELDPVPDLSGLSGFEPDRDATAALILRSLFRQSKKLRRRVSEQRKFRASERFVSLHARLGKEMGEDNQPRFNYSMQGTTLEKVAHCVGAAAGRELVRRKMRHLVMSSDTRQAYPAIRAGILSVASGAKTVTMGGRAMHLRHMRTPTDRNLEGFLTTYTDIALLAEGESLVYLESGFADVIVWFGAMKRRIEVQVSTCPNT